MIRFKFNFFFHSSERMNKKKISYCPIEKGKKSRENVCLWSTNENNEQKKNSRKAKKKKIDPKLFFLSSFKWWIQIDWLIDWMSIDQNSIFKHSSIHCFKINLKKKIHVWEAKKNWIMIMMIMIMMIIQIIKWKIDTNKKKWMAKFFQFKLNLDNMKLGEYNRF